MFHAASFALLGAALIIPTAAQESLTLSGRLVDASGQPVAGGVVILSCQGAYPVFGDLDRIAQATSDDAGQLVLELSSDWVGRHESYRSLWVAAHAEGHGVFIGSWDPEEVPAVEELVLVLPPLETFDVRVTDETGAPVVGARVAPSRLRRTGSYGVRIHDGFWTDRHAMTDADGRAALPAPHSDIGAITVWVDGQPGQVFSAGDRADAVSSDLRVVRGEFVDVRSDGVDAGGLTLGIQSYALYADVDEVKVARQIRASYPLGGPQSRVWISTDTPRLTLRSEDTRSHALEVEYKAPEADATAPGVITLRAPETLYTWSGQVLDAGGQPVAGIGLHFVAKNRGRAVTDAEGKFAFPCGLSGGQLRYVQCSDLFGAPSDHRGRSASAPEGSTECKFEPIEVQPFWAPSACVIDVAGKPIAGAFVVVKQEVPTSRGAMTTKVMTAVTGQDGKFQARGAWVGRPVQIFARTAAQNGSRLLDEADGDALLTLAPSLFLHGHVIAAPSGETVAGARLSLDALPDKRPRRRVMSGGSLTVVAGADGSFRFQAALDPEEDYVLTFEADTIQREQLAPMSGAELAEMHTFQAQSLRSMHVRLMDENGAPLEGAELRLRSSGAVVRTDASGSALLTGGAPANDVVLARTSTGTWWVQALDSEASALQWKLTDDAALDSLLAGAPDRAYEQRIAANLAVLELEIHLEVDDMDRALRAIRRLSWSDPIEVLRRIDGGLFGTTYRSDWSVSYVAEALTKVSPQESLSVSQRLAPDLGRVLRVLAAARELPLADELECLALERASLRAIASPEYRLVALANLCERFVQLGRTGVAQPLYVEGAKIAESLPTSDWSGFARANFGEALALVDQQAALEMIESIEGDGDKNRHFGNIAHKLASVNPAASEEWLDRCKLASGSFGVDRYISRVAYHMAPLDLERALRLANTYDRRGFSHGMIALALHRAGRPSNETIPVLHVAFQRVSALSSLPRPTWLERPLPVAGALLPVAAEIDPDHFRNWLAWSLAVPSGAHDRARSAKAEVELPAQAALGFYVALFDPALARGLVEPCLAFPEANGSESIPSEYRHAWAALAVIDAQEASRRAQGVGAAAMAIVSETLGRSRTERTYHVQTEYLNLWAPGKEDI